MTDEEKKSIEQLDYELTDSWVHNKGISKETLTLFKKVTEKQQKEMEEQGLRLLELAHKLTFDYISKDKIRDYKNAVEWKRQQEIENLGMSMLGSAIDVLNKLLKE